MEKMAVVKILTDEGGGGRTENSFLRYWCNNYHILNMDGIYNKIWILELVRNRCMNIWTKASYPAAQFPPPPCSVPSWPSWPWWACQGPSSAGRSRGRRRPPGTPPARGGWERPPCWLRTARGSNWTEVVKNGVGLFWSLVQQQPCTAALYSLVQQPCTAALYSRSLVQQQRPHTAMSQDGGEGDPITSSFNMSCSAPQGGPYNPWVWLPDPHLNSSRLSGQIYLARWQKITDFFQTLPSICGQSAIVGATALL